MATYRVERDGKTVWSDDTGKKPGTVAHFPDEYTDRPETGETHLVIDDVVVGVQIPLVEEYRQMVERHDAATEKEG